VRSSSKETVIAEMPNGAKPKTIVEKIAAKRSAFPLKEFAELMNIEYGTAHQMAKDGRLPGVMRVGSSIRLDPATIADWLRQRTSA
jgi:excisionase family DNA binding protein